MSDRLHLKRIKAHRFGRFTDRTLGPLSSGLTVIHGRNEAGKSTFASLITQTLFGWLRRTAKVNNYAPTSGKRHTSLFFGDESGEWEFSREDGGKDPERSIAHVGLPRPDLIGEVVGDVAEETFTRMFSFDAEELATFIDDSDITARLVTAEAGTAVAPVQAYEAIEEALKRFTGSGAAATESLPLLRGEIRDLQARETELQAEARAFFADEVRAAELEGSASRRKARIAELEAEKIGLDASIQALERVRDDLERTAADESEARASADSARREQAACEIPALTVEAAERIGEHAETVGVIESRKTSRDREVKRLSELPPLAGAPPVDGLDEALVEAVDRLAHDESALITRLDEAHAALREHEAELARLVEASARSSDAASGDRRVRAGLVSLAVTAATGFAAAAGGAFVEMPMVLWAGLGLAALSVLLMVLVALRSRSSASRGGGVPNPAAADLSGTRALRDNAERQHIGVQDDLDRLRARAATTLTSCGIEPDADLGITAKRLRTAWGDSLIERDAARIRADIAEYDVSLDEWSEATATLLTGYGIEVPVGSTVTETITLVRRARLDAKVSLEAHEELRRATQLCDTTQEALDRFGGRVEDVRRQAVDLLASIGVEHDGSPVTPTVLDAHRARLRAESDALAESIAHESAEREELIGDRAEIVGRLDSQGRSSELVTVQEAIAAKTQLLADRSAEYAALLVAHRTIGAAIGRWEQERQPEILRAASGIFSDLTGGEWRTIREGDKKGELVAIDADQNVREPSKLSTGTVQQMYLALRIALLDASPGVGPSLPVVMDDPLIAFDPSRRAAAIDTVAKFSERRQVLFFTQDPQTADALTAASDTAKRIDL